MATSPVPASDELVERLREHALGPAVCYCGQVRSAPWSGSCQEEGQCAWNRDHGTHSDSFVNAWKAKEDMVSAADALTAQSALLARLEAAEARADDARQNFLTMQGVANKLRIRAEAAEAERNRLAAVVSEAREESDAAFETVAQWHDKNARLCLEASKDDPRLNADDRRRAFEAHKHHAASAASIRLKLVNEWRAASAWREKHGEAG